MNWIKDNFVMSPDKWVTPALQGQLPPPNITMVTDTNANENRGSDNLPLPIALGNHPSQWSRENVSTWLDWCNREFSLNENGPESRFEMNGKALLLLTKEDFNKRVPGGGDVLYNNLHNILQVTKEKSEVSPSPVRENQCGNLLSPNFNLAFPVSWASPTGSGTHPLNLNEVFEANQRQINHAFPLPGDRTMKREQPYSWDQAIEQPKKFAKLSMPGGDFSVPEVNNRSSTSASPSSSNSDAAEDNSKRVVGPSGLLWEFIRNLLADDTHSSCIRWADKDQLIFRIVNPEGLARLWGLQKNRDNMTYEKMSRALRYYYRSGIMKKVPQKKLMYQFMIDPEQIPKMPRGGRQVKSDDEHLLLPVCMAGVSKTEAQSPATPFTGLALDLSVKKELDLMIENVQEHSDGRNLPFQDERNESPFHSKSIYGPIYGQDSAENESAIDLSKKS